MRWFISCCHVLKKPWAWCINRWKDDISTVHTAWWDLTHPCSSEIWHIHAAVRSDTSTQHTSTAHTGAVWSDASMVKAVGSDVSQQEWDDLAYPWRTQQQRDLTHPRCTPQQWDLTHPRCTPQQCDLMYPRCTQQQWDVTHPRCTPDLTHPRRNHSSVIWHIHGAHSSSGIWHIHGAHSSSGIWHIHGAHSSSGIWHIHGAHSSSGIWHIHGAHSSSGIWHRVALGSTAHRVAVGSDTFTMWLDSTAKVRITSAKMSD